jgi:pimeloyl-ACP methyl ester carboxylesterase
LLLDAGKFEPGAARSGRLEAAGHALEYADIAAAGADRPALVFLHEGLGCVAGWKDFPRRLAATSGCRAFSYSRAGYGGSSGITLPRPIDYMEPEGLTVLPAVLDAARIGDCVLVGHSDGGTIALINAGGVGDPRVRGLVLLAPHVYAEPCSLDAIRAARAAFEGGELRARLREYHGDNVDDAFWGWCDTWLDPRFLEWTIERYLPGIEIPVLQIQGEHDQYGTRIQLECIERGVSGSVTTHVLAACGHAPHVQQSEATFGLIMSFLRDLVPA